MTDKERLQRVLEEHWLAKTEDELKESLKIKERKKQLNKIDFRCNIQNNTCRKNKHNKKLCCSRCAVYFGYFEHSLTTRKVFDRKDIEKIVSLYNSEDGFWKESIGCVLPRELRSNVCNLHTCLDTGNVVLAFLDGTISFKHLEEVIQESKYIYNFMLE